MFKWIKRVAEDEQVRGAWKLCEDEIRRGVKLGFVFTGGALGNLIDGVVGDMVGKDYADEFEKRVDREIKNAAQPPSPSDP